MGTPVAADALINNALTAPRIGGLIGGRAPRRLRPVPSHVAHGRISAANTGRGPRLKTCATWSPRICVDGLPHPPHDWHALGCPSRAARMRRPSLA